MLQEYDGYGNGLMMEREREGGSTLKGEKDYEGTKDMNV